MVLLMEEDDGLGSKVIDSSLSGSLDRWMGYLLQGVMSLMEEGQQVELLLLGDLIIFVGGVTSFDAWH